jgi:hypothetical protein
MMQDITFSGHLKDLKPRSGPQGLPFSLIFHVKPCRCDRQVLKKEHTVVAQAPHEHHIIPGATDNAKNHTHMCTVPLLKEFLAKAADALDDQPLNLKDAFIQAEIDAAGNGETLMRDGQMAIVPGAKGSPKVRMMITTMMRRPAAKEKKKKTSEDDEDISYHDIDGEQHMGDCPKGHRVPTRW